jgi:hypothetical protein
MWLTALYVLGSLSSIVGMIVSFHVYWRDKVIADEVHKLKGEEEAWHGEKADVARSS